jgi:hypothetical protein
MIDKLIKKYIKEKYGDCYYSYKIEIMPKKYIKNNPRMSVIVKNSRYVNEFNKNYDKELK